MTMTITMVAISMTMMGVVVILRLMLSYHNVQLGQWELVGRQNFIIGVWNIVKGIISLYWEYFWNIEHFFQLNRITMKSFQGWCSWSRSTWRTGRCTAMSLQRSGNLPEKRSLKKHDLFLPGMEGKTLMCWVSPSGRTSTLPPARYTQTHHTSKPSHLSFPRFSPRWRAIRRPSDRSRASKRDWSKSSVVSRFLLFG